MKRVDSAMKRKDHEVNSLIKRGKDGARHFANQAIRHLKAQPGWSAIASYA
jgi:hypothetical protein